MSEENKELEFDQELVEDQVEKKACECNNGYDDTHYRQIDYARVNINAKEADGAFIKNVSEAKSDLIKSLKEVLGTMVQEPTYESNPQIIGEKQFKMYIQKPIIEGENREKVIKKLVELIDSL